MNVANFLLEYVGVNREIDQENGIFEKAADDGDDGD